MKKKKVVVKKVRKKVRKKKVRRGKETGAEAVRRREFTEKGRARYEGYVKRIEVLENFGADVSPAIPLVDTAGEKLPYLEDAGGLKDFLGVCREIEREIGGIQGKFVNDTTEALEIEMEKLAGSGADIRELRHGLDSAARLGRPEPGRMSVERLNEWVDVINGVRFGIKGVRETLSEEIREEVTEGGETEVGAAEGGEGAMDRGASEEMGTLAPHVARETLPGEEAAYGEGETETVGEASGEETLTEEGARADEVREVGESAAMPETAEAAAVAKTAEAAEAAEVIGEAEEGAEEELEDEATLAKKAEATELINAAYEKVIRAKEEVPIIFTRAMKLIEDSGELFEEGRYDEIGDLEGAVGTAIDESAERWKELGRRLDLCRKELISFKERGIVKAEITELFADARNNLEASEFERAEEITGDLEERIAGLSADFEDSVASIENVKSLLTAAREEGVDVSRERSDFSSFRELLSEGRFDRIGEVIGEIEESVRAKRGNSVREEIESTKLILDKAPSYIDLSEPFSMLESGKEELEDGELEKARDTIEKSKNRAMEIRNAYIFLVERANEIGERLGQLEEDGLIGANVGDVFKDSKKALKDGDFGACEEGLNEVEEEIAAAEGQEFDRLAREVEEEIASGYDKLEKLAEAYPGADLSALRSGYGELRERYGEAGTLEVMRQLYEVSSKLATMLEEDGEELSRIEEEKRLKAKRLEIREKVERCRSLMEDIRPQRELYDEMGEIQEALGLAKEERTEEALSLLDRTYESLVEKRKELDMEIEVSVRGEGFGKNSWSEAEVILTNSGSFTLTDISVELDGPFRTQRDVHFNRLGSGDSQRTAMAMNFSDVGRIPVDVSIRFVSQPDGKLRERRYQDWLWVETEAPYAITMPSEKAAVATALAPAPTAAKGPGEEIFDRKTLEVIPELDICPVCKRQVDSDDPHYLCGCNQLYHKKCAESITINSCVSCAAPLFDPDHILLVSCPVCNEDIWYDDELVAHDCGEIYHRDCLLSRGRCLNCHGSVDSPEFYFAACTVCREIIHEDDDFESCNCGEAYHPGCFENILFCTRCGTLLGEAEHRGGEVGGAVRGSEAMVPVDDAASGSGRTSKAAAEMKPLTSEGIERENIAGRARAKGGDQRTSMRELPEEGTAEVGSAKAPSEERREEKGGATGREGETAKGDVSEEEDNLESLLEDIEKDL